MSWGGSLDSVIREKMKELILGMAQQVGLDIPGTSDQSPSLSSMIAAAMESIENIVLEHNQDLEILELEPREVNSSIEYSSTGNSSIDDDYSEYEENENQNAKRQRRESENWTLDEMKKVVDYKHQNPYKPRRWSSLKKRFPV